MIDALNWIMGWLDGLWQKLLDFVKTIFLVLWDLVIDLVCFVMDAVFGVVVTLISSIPMPQGAGFNAQTYLQGAPAEFLGMLVAIRVPEALALIVVALGIRFLLQLIPFIRLGS